MSFFKRLFNTKENTDSTLEFTKFTSNNFKSADLKSEDNPDDSYDDNKKIDYTAKEGYLVYKRCVGLATYYFYEKGFGVIEIDEDYTNYPQLKLKKPGQKDIFIYIEYTWAKQTFEELFNKESIEEQRKMDIDMNSDTMLLKYNFEDDGEETFYEEKHYKYTLEERLLP